MKKKYLSPEQLNDQPTDVIIFGLRMRRLSVLKTFGLSAYYCLLLPIHSLVGLTLRLIFNYKEETKIFNNIDMSARNHARELLEKFTPYTEEGNYPPARIRLASGQLSGPDFPVVIGFNHPSLGEIARLAVYCFKYYPEKQIFFPVTLPWYEMLAPFSSKLRRLGITMTPLITPHAAATLEKSQRKHPDNLKYIANLRNRFQFRYLNLCKKMAAENNVILVAPSAKRQATIFPDEETFHGKKKLPKVMELMGKIAPQAYFLPICVIPPNHYLRTVNLFRSYILMPAEHFTPEQVKEYCKTKDFDFNFYTRLLMHSAQSFWYPREN
ncbi:MAG: hypothetical protein Q4E46_00035 [Candidatus Saccharibacteria bacterium]|nr:hypothetical protein [Candidatus Saccharibacteria bacterium]